jgi:hypothetical protein
MNANKADTLIIRLIRVTAWGQAIGFLAMYAFLLADPAPISLDGGDLGTLLVLFVVIGAASIPRTAKFIIRAFSGIALSLLVIAISLATLLTAIAGVSLSFSIPDELVTEAWQYTRTTSLITLVIFLAAFIANVFLAVQLIQADRRTSSIEGSV